MATLKTAANNLARLIEQAGLDAIDEFYAKHGNAAIPALVRQCIKDVDQAYKSAPDTSTVEQERRRLRLWLHLVSEHKAMMDPFEPLASLEDMHQHEHTGPGTLGKGEPVEPLPFKLHDIGEVLSECDEDGSPWDSAT